MPHARALCLIDEGAKVGTSLIGSKGSSVLIEVDGHRVLFDTGRSGRYLVHNMQSLDVGFDSIDTVVISHASIDHIGGLDNLMSYRKVPVDVYSTNDVWGVKRTFGGSLLTGDNAGGIRMHEAGSDWMQVTEHLYITPCINAVADELALVLRTNEGPVVFSACAHGGIVDTLDVVKKKFGRIRTLVGGIHLKKAKQDAVNVVAAEITETYDVKEIYLNGCTTGEGIQKMRVATSNSRIKDFFVGDELNYTV